ncbi:DUF3159 domain-containing protein [Actinophytocola sediminis]
MSLTLLTQKSFSLFSAMGGWRTVADGVASRVVFLVAYLLTGEVVAAALIATGGVFLLAVVRMCTDRRFWQPAVGLVVVGVSALFAGSTGQAVDFYLYSVLLQAGGLVVFGASMLVGWPVIGVVMGAVRGEHRTWRHDRRARGRYQVCTAVFLVKFVIATAVLVPLYLTGQVVALGVTATVLGGAPGAGACLYLCWRILRTDAASAPAVASGVTNQNGTPAATSTRSPTSRTS